MKKQKILILNYEFPPLGGGASPVSYELAKNKNLNKQNNSNNKNMFPSDLLRSLDDFFKLP